MGLCGGNQEKPEFLLDLRSSISKAAKMLSSNFAGTDLPACSLWESCLAQRRASNSPRHSSHDSKCFSTSTRAAGVKRLSTSSSISSLKWRLCVVILISTIPDRNPSFGHRAVTPGTAACALEIDESAMFLSDNSKQRLPLRMTSLRRLPIKPLNGN